MTDDVVIRIAPLPDGVQGYTSPSPDGWMNVYINEKLFPEQMREALVHEICHIKQGHFSGLMQLEEVEAI